MRSVHLVQISRLAKAEQVEQMTSFDILVAPLIAY